jgi:hypothetical protein
MRPPAVVAALLTLLALAPAALAKGPHASVASGPAGLKPGEPWVTTLTLVEYGGREVAAARPFVVLRSGSDRFAVRPRRIGLHVPGDPEMLAEARYRLRVVFPRAGRWTYTVVDGTRAERRFRFPAAPIGAGAERATSGYVEFARGSRAHREGGGGAIVAESIPQAPEADGGAPPDSAPRPEDDGGGIALWIPLTGLTVVAAAAAATASRRSGRARVARSARQ